MGVVEDTFLTKFINSLLAELSTKANKNTTVFAPLTPTTSSAGSSPSSKGKRKSYPPSPLTALETPGNCTDEEVELRLTFLDKTYSSRYLTPRSQIFLDLYQKTSLLLLSETNSTKRALHQTSLQLFDKFLEGNSSILDETKSQTELRENLSRLKLFEYYSRYGDYFAYQSSHLKETATEIQISGYKIFRHYWDKASEDIVREMKLIKGNPGTSASTLHSYLALINGAAAMGVDFYHLLTWASQYVWSKSKILRSKS